MNKETAIAKRQAQERDERALLIVLEMIPEGITLEEAKILLDCTFYTQEAVAQKHGVCRETVNRTVQRYRHAYNQLLDAKKQIRGALAESASYSAIQTLDKYLRDDPKLKNVKEAALLCQIALMLQKIVDATPERSGARHVDVTMEEPPRPPGLVFAQPAS